MQRKNNQPKQSNGDTLEDRILHEKINLAFGIGRPSKMREKFKKNIKKIPDITRAQIITKDVLKQSNPQVNQPLPVVTQNPQASANSPADKQLSAQELKRELSDFQVNQPLPVVTQDPQASANPPADKQLSTQELKRKVSETVNDSLTFFSAKRQRTIVTPSQPAPQKMNITYLLDTPTPPRRRS